MKPFIFFKLPIVLLCLGGALVMATQSRAQSEIAPDHFDGTDSWATASVKATAQKARQQASASTSQAGNSNPATPALQPVAARTVTAPRRSDAVATKKRKPTSKPNN